MTSVSNAYPCLVPFSYLGAKYVSFEYLFLEEKKNSAHIKKQSHGHVKKIKINQWCSVVPENPNPQVHGSVGSDFFFHIPILHLATIVQYSITCVGDVTEVDVYSQ